MIKNIFIQHFYLSVFYRDSTGDGACCLLRIFDRSQWKITGYWRNRGFWKIKPHRFDSFEKVLIFFLICKENCFYWFVLRQCVWLVVPHVPWAIICKLFKLSRHVNKRTKPGSTRIFVDLMSPCLDVSQRTRQDAVNLSIFFWDHRTNFPVFNIVLLTIVVVSPFFVPVGIKTYWMAVLVKMRKNAEREKLHLIFLNMCFVLFSIYFFNCVHDEWFNTTPYFF